MEEESVRVKEILGSFEAVSLQGVELALMVQKVPQMV